MDLNYGLGTMTATTFNLLVADSYAFIFNCTTVGRLVLSDGTDLNRL